MRIRARSFACLAGLALALPAPAAAQRGVPALRMGDSLRVVISASDPVLTEWGSYRAFRFEGQPDHLYRFTAQPDSITASLHVARLAGTLTDYIERAASSRAPSLHFRPPAPGPYFVVVASHEPGAVTLYGEEMASAAAAPRPLAVGDSVQATLNAGAGVSIDGDWVQYYALHTFAARAGQDLEILVRGPVNHDFGRMRDGSFVAIPPADAEERAGFVTAPEDGEYAVRVLGPGGGGSPYTLRVRDARPRPEPRRLEVGPPMDGTFDRGTAVFADGALVDEWVLRARQGQHLQFDLSGAFDTYVAVGRIRDGRWDELGANDDYDEGTNSRVPLLIPEDGDYIIRVRPYIGDFDRGGPYTLQVSHSVAAQPAAADDPRLRRPETRRVTWGQPLTGTLDATDAAEQDGSPYDAWTFSATAGQRITITMRSESFDAYLAVGRDEDGEWMELTSNDDVVGQSGKDARVVMVAPDTGEYTIRANTFPRQPGGAYVLTVEREH